MPLFDGYLALLVLAMLAAHHLLRSPRLRVVVLCLGSAAAVGYLDPIALAVTAVLGAATYAAGRVARRITGKGARRCLTVLVVGGLLAALLVSRYARTAAVALGLPEGVGVGWACLGMSFLTFRLIAYFVDQLHPRSQPAPPSQFALYVLFLPTYIAGPLERWVSYGKGPTVALDAREVGRALERILYGVAKKVLLADRLALLIAERSLSPESLSHTDAWLLWLACGWRNYFDFAGYSDIAIGLGRLFGYEIMENFQSPFRSRSVVEFWRRWHISLSEWIRSYIFMPLVRRKPTPVRMHVATLVSMALCGAWHGAAWSFALWGLLHGVALSLCHLWNAYRRKAPWAEAVAQSRYAGAISVALTYGFVSSTFVLFAVPFPVTVAVFRSLF